MTVLQYWCIFLFAIACGLVTAGVINITIEVDDKIQETNGLNTYKLTGIDTFYTFETENCTILISHQKRAIAISCVNPKEE